ncbi:MAG: ATP-binding protein [Bacteroidales bacterium]|nr:ATP-binding protein [Bacteroidales bacterium]MCF8403449.1 ATP-binding protein [Bacteroidales bacterium]
MAKSLYIQNLILEGEHQKLDFKFAISDAKKIARSFVAFANSEGGTLLIGVKDDGDIAGIRSSEERFMAKKASEEYCKPVIDFVSKEWRINNKVVLEIKIKVGEKRPYFALGEDGQLQMFIRVHDQNILADKILVEGWKRKYSDQGAYINYTDNDRRLLEYLEHNERISFKKFLEIVPILPGEAKTILINFIALNIIQFEFIGKEFFYRLSDEYKADVT